MRKRLGKLAALLLSLVMALSAQAALAEDEPSIEIENGWATGIEEDEKLSYEQEHDLPTGISGTLYAYVKTSNGNSLNMRADTTTNSQVITTMPYGAKVQVTGYYSSSWAAVVYGSNNGYCMTRYLSDTKPAPVSTKGTTASDSSADLQAMFDGFEAVSYDAVVVPSTPTGYVNLRWAPTKKSPTQAIYRSGNVVKVIAEGKDWVQLYDESTGTAGFMMRAFLTRIAEPVTENEAQ